MALSEHYIQIAVENKRELEHKGISPADFYSIINHDNIQELLDKVEKLEKEVKYLRNEVNSLKR